MKKKITVALNMSRLSVPNKIKRARFIAGEIAANGPLFPNPLPTLVVVTNGINALETAWNDAADGGKTKTAIMHAKEDDLMKLMTDLAHYVERIANGDEEIVFTAGMQVKQPGQINIPEFSVEHTEHHGEVLARVKPRTKTMYRWEYCKDPMEPGGWKVAKITDVCMTNIQDLEEAAKFWFRVVFINKVGETIPYNPIYIIVC